MPERFLVGIGPYDPERDAEDLAAFQLRMYGEGSRQVDRNRFRWLFEQNPYLDPDRPSLWVCRRDGAIVGQQAEIPFELQVGDRNHRAAWAIDLMVDPAWRLRGVGPGLIATQRQQHSIVAGLNISDKGQATYRRAGWTDLGIVPVYLRPLRADRALRIAPVPDRLRRLAPLAGPGLTAADTLLTGGIRAGGARLVPVDRLDERTDEVWRSSANHYTTLARRDLHALAWRIDQRPDRDTLVRSYLTRRGKAIGYVVLRPTTWSGEPVAVVVDYLAPPRWVAPLLLLAGRRAAREQGAVALLAKTRNEPADRWLRAAGFLRRNEGADPPIRFMVHCADDDPEVCAAVQDPTGWFVTSADSDLEYATTPTTGSAPSAATTDRGTSAPPTLSSSAATAADRPGSAPGSSPTPDEDRVTRRNAENGSTFRSADDPLDPTSPDGPTTASSAAAADENGSAPTGSDGSGTEGPS